MTQHRLGHVVLSCVHMLQLLCRYIHERCFHKVDKRRCHNHPPPYKRTLQPLIGDNQQEGRIRRTYRRGRRLRLPRRYYVVSRPINREETAGEHPLLPQQSGKQNCLLLRRAASKEKQDTTRDLVERDRANVQTHQKTRKAKGLPDHKQEACENQGCQ